MHRHPFHRLPAVVIVLLVASCMGLLLAGVAAATRQAATDHVRVRLTAAGRAAASAVVIKRADLGPVPGWTGGRKKASAPSPIPCASYNPKQSDLVVTGLSETQWKHSGVEFESDAQVMATPRMVRLDWRRTVVARQVLPCMRSQFAKKDNAKEHFVSVRWVAFPQVARYTRALRLLVDVTTAGGKVRLMVDAVAFGSGRTEVTLTTTAPQVTAPAVRPAEIRLARLLADRIRR
jgi:hypothetical protein